MDIWEEMYNKAKKEYHPEEVSPFIIAHHVVAAVENEDGEIVITVKPTDHNKVKDVLESINPDVHYELDEEGMYAKDKVTLEGEDLELFERLLSLLEDIDDVSDIYHNVNL